MPNWALVVGVDKYWVPEASLRGAVRDALHVREWLIESGNVPEANITMVLGPDQTAVPAGIAAAVPTQDEIINAISAIVAKSGGKGDRFFFHFSGHGLSTLRDYAAVDAILCSDVTANNPTRSFTVRSLTEYFATTEFAEQFFFIDACRNVPWPGQFRVGDLPWQPTRDPNKPPVQQFVMFAASPGVKAAEDVAEIGNEQGAFTESLLAGLRGEGRAKAWDLRDDEYVVRFERLLQFVIDDVQAKRKNVGERGRRLLQLPRRTGEHGAVTGSNPVLARFPAAAFAKHKLEVAIDPFNAAANTVLQVRGGAAELERTAIAEVPVAVELPPDEYKVRCRAEGYVEAEKKGWYIELWEPQSLTVKLDVDPAAADGAEATLEFSTVVRGPAAPVSTNIRIYSYDELAPLELYDSSGVLIESGTGALKKYNVAPGRYRAVLRMPGAEAVSRTIDVEEGESEDVRLDAAPPAAGAVMHGGQVLDDNTVLISETSGVGPVASAQLSTLLALAGGASLVDPQHLDAYHLRAIGLQTFQTKMPSEASGTMLLVADETETAELVRSRVRMWGIDAPIAPARLLLPRAPHVAEYAEPAQPGAYWIALEPPNEPPLMFASAVLPSRVHMLVLARGADGQVQTYAYLPRTEATHESPRQLRRLEMMQRHYAAGTFDRARELVEQKFADPTMGCLGGYLYLRRGQANQLSEVVYNMTTYFGELSDSFVLKGEYETARNQTALARAAYITALDRGVPLVLEGVGRLRAAAELLRIEHPRRALLERIWELRVRDAIWTTWVPRTLPERERI